MDVLVTCLTTLAEDLAFLALSTGAVDPGVWAELSKRRAAALEGELKGTMLARSSTLDAWVVPLVRVLAPVAEIGWMPMHQLSSAITLQAGARGVRSLFSSKPNEKDIEKARTLGSLAVRTLATVMEADGARSATEQRLVWSLVASLGVSEADEAALSGVGGGVAEALVVPGDLEPKIAQNVVRGAWAAASLEGLGPKHEAAVIMVANRMNVPLTDTAALGVEVKRESERRASLGRACAGALSFVLRDRPGHATPLGQASIELLVPEPFRRDAVAETIASTSPNLTAARAVDKAHRAALLAFTWAGALTTDPNVSRRAVLATRHDSVADAIGAGGDATKIRESVERMIAAVLERLARMTAT